MTTAAPAPTIAASNPPPCPGNCTEVARAHSRLDELERRVGHLPDEIDGTPATGLAKLMSEVREAQKEQGTAIKEQGKAIEALRATVQADLDSRKQATIGETVRRWLPLASMATGVFVAAAAAVTWLARHISWRSP